MEKLVRAFGVAVLLAAFGAYTSCSEPPSDTLALPISGKVYETTCVACHGTVGEGNIALNVPSIAGLPAWYVADQLGEFQTGRRGGHAEDVFGQQMRAVAALLSEAHVAEVSEHIEALTPILPKLVGTPEQIEMGRKLYASVCMECHRFNGSGDQFFASTPLTGLPAWYHIRQMRHYRDGLRGADELDEAGQKMMRVTGWLSDEQIDALGVYLTALAHGDDPRTVMER